MLRLIWVIAGCTGLLLFLAISGSFLYPWYTRCERVYSLCPFRLYVHVCVCVCVCARLFSSKIFSETTAPRTLKFGTNVGYDLLYCVFPLFVQFCFSPTEFSVTVFKFSTHLESGQVYCGKKQDAEIYFCLLFHFSWHFHLSLQCIM